MKCVSCPEAIGQRLILSGILSVLLVLGCSSETQPELVDQPDSILADLETSEEASEQWFDEVAGEVGVSHTYDSGHRDLHLFPEIVGGGGALFDADGDGDLDLLLLQAGNLEDQNFGVHRLWINDQGKFTLSQNRLPSSAAGYGMGVAAGDIDQDGDLDLFISQVGRNLMLRNEGDGTFVDVTEASGVAGNGWHTSCAFLDVDRDGDLDLYVARYVAWRLESDLRCRSANGRADYCSPNSYKQPMSDLLFFNHGDGTFQDRSLESNISSATGNGLGVTVFDYNQDGWLDIFVANDMTANLLWKNLGDGRFQESAEVAGVSVDRDGVHKAGMGVAVADLDLNGSQDLLVVNMVGQSDSLFMNRGGRFEDQTIGVGLGIASRNRTRFGVGFHDFDGDGDMDLFQANGKVILGQRPQQGDPYSEGNLVLENREGYFEERTSVSAISAPLTSRAAIFGDWDNDGDVDVIVVNKDAPVQMFRNRAGAGSHWIGIDVQSTDESASVGARVEVRQNGNLVANRIVNPHYSYLSSNDPRVVVGLGSDSSEVEVTVISPNGARHPYTLAPNQYHTLPLPGTTTPIP